MKRIYKFIFIFMIIIFLNACNKRNENVNKSEYIYFNYNCNNKIDYHKCELKNSKINCDIKEPSCEDKEFIGWYRANEYENPVDLTSKFNTNEIIYARWNDGSGEEPSSQQIEEPSSNVEEPSSYIPDEPSSNEQPSSSNEQPSSSQTPTVTKYNLSFDGNGGSTVSSSKSVAYNATLPSINEKPVRSWYTFMGWYDNKDYTKGTKYYNESNTPVRKYDKKANIKLYAGWKKNTLSIRYNGNGGVWNNPTKNVYSVNQYGTVTLKKDGSIFQAKYNYDENIPTTGLLNYNGSYLNWKKDGYTVESKKEYIIQNGTATTVLDQDRSYTSVELAKYGGCDLSKKNCLITVKVNWNKIIALEPIKPSSSENVIRKEETDTLKVYITKESTYFITRIWVQNPYIQLKKQNANPYGSKLSVPSKLLENAINEKDLSNRLIIGFNASGFYLKDIYDPKSVEYYPPYNKTSVGSLVITEGKVIRNNYSKGDITTWFISGVTKDNILKVFVDKKMQETSVSEKQAWAQQVIDSGIRNTYTFAAPIILNGKKTNYSCGNSRMPAKNNEKIGLQLLCQINSNNFVLYTTKYNTRNKGIDLFLKMGCTTAVNLDGGGSVTLLFKESKSKKIDVLLGNERELPEVGYFSQ